jgi:NADH:ubiquinone oxidoreductase subunit H
MQSIFFLSKEILILDVFCYSKFFFLWFFVLLIFFSNLLLVAFFTLLERKVMGAAQKRRGPDITGYKGILQPFADGFKLFLKQTIIPKSSNKFSFFLSSIFTFALSFLSFALISFNSYGPLSNPELSLLFLFFISSLNILGLILSG